MTLNAFPSIPPSRFFENLNRVSVRTSPLPGRQRMCGRLHGSCGRVGGAASTHLVRLAPLWWLVSARGSRSHCLPAPRAASTPPIPPCLSCRQLPPACASAADGLAAAVAVAVMRGWNGGNGCERRAGLSRITLFMCAATCRRAQ